MSFLGLGKTESKENKNAAVSPVKAGHVSVSGLIKKPVVSEKALSGEAKGQYVFKISQNATKPEIKKEIENKYGVKVSRVNVIVSKPKKVFFRGRTSFKAGLKKAMVKFKAGQKLELNSK